MEDGVLRTDEFKKFSEDYVMFLHITTRIEGRENDGLLGDVGGTGFPTLVVLDATGSVIAKHGRRPRTVETARGLQLA